MKRDLFIAYLALAAICLIWGTTYLALRIAVLHFPPFLFIAIRQVIAGMLLAGFMLLIKKTPWPPIDILMRQAVGGFLMISLGNGLVAWAEMHIPSGVAAVICSLMPVIVILINLTVNREERPTLPIIVGVILGFAGIVIIFSEYLSDFSKQGYTLGILFTFIAIVSWAAGSVWIKKSIGTANLFLNAGLQMLFGGLWLFPVSLLFDDLTNVTFSSEAAYAMIYLIIIGSVVAYACYSYALKKLPMTILSLYAYINPIVAVLLGWLVLDEKLNLQIAVAIAVTVAGIYIVNRGYQFKAFWKTQYSSNR